MGSYAYQFTIIFQTALNFASASRQKFSHDDFQKEIHEICISNKQKAKTLTNRIQCAFDEYFRFYKKRDSNIAPKTRAIINIDMLLH